MTFKEYFKEEKKTTVGTIVDILGVFGDVSSDDVVKYLKQIKADDNLIADVFTYYHIPDEDYIDDNGDWLK